MIQNLTDNKKTNYSIDTGTSVEDKILEVLKNIPYGKAVVHLNNVKEELTRQNGLNIVETVSKFARQHPKIKEPSNSYKHPRK